METAPTAFLGIDTGGTFTDFALLAAGQLRVHKELSTPAAPQEAILSGIRALGLQTMADNGELVIIHGTTVATNAALQGKGVRTVYITNKGLKDVLLIGRQTRQQLYDLTPALQHHAFDENLMLEINARLDAQGNVIEPLTTADLKTLQRQVEALQPVAIAINLLFSFLDPEHEQRIEAVFAEDYFVSRSSSVLPQQREYERGMTTWLNAWLGPLIKAYLLSLGRAVAPSKLAIMQSSGLTISAEHAAERAVNLLLSGPAGGLAAAVHIGRQTGQQQLMTFDMGGTSTDVALLEGEIRLTDQGRIASYPVAVPMADIHTIGAGGGSIAYVDAGGLLQVGPASAGASPGPACYGRGGTAATVTDANLMLGRLREDAFLGGKMPLHRKAAEAALLPLAEALQISTTAVALGIVKIANENMIQALRVISIQRGYDPRAFTLMSFGGAGGLHICELAEALEIRQAVVPLNSGVLSALGMLAAQPGRELVRTRQGLMHAIDEPSLAAELQLLLQEAQAELRQEGVFNTRHQNQLDLRYQGQTYSIAIAYEDITQAVQAFHLAHQRLYGHTLPKAVELLSLRVHVEAERPPFKLPGVDTAGRTQATDASSAPALTVDNLVDAQGKTIHAPLYQRGTLPVNCLLRGPALIIEEHTSVFLKAGWQATLDETGNLQLQNQQQA